MQAGGPVLVAEGQRPMLNEWLSLSQCYLHIVRDKASVAAIIVRRCTARDAVEASAYKSSARSTSGWRYLILVLLEPVPQRQRSRVNVQYRPYSSRVA